MVQSGWHVARQFVATSGIKQRSQVKALPTHTQFFPVSSGTWKFSLSIHSIDGLIEGNSDDGLIEGNPDDGVAEGPIDGTSEGTKDGLIDGRVEGSDDGNELGTSEGTAVVHRGSQVARQFANTSGISQYSQGLSLAIHRQYLNPLFGIRKVGLSIHTIVGSMEGRCDGELEGLVEGTNEGA